MNDLNRFSVLMSVYRNDDPDHFDDAMTSVMIDQSRRPDEMVLVVDGPVGKELNDRIERWERRYVRPGRSIQTQVIRNPQNIGLAASLNRGLARCRYELVARMDSDDVSLPDRFEDQIGHMIQNQQTSLVGSWYRQFDRAMQRCLTDRKLPTDRKRLTRYAKTRTPFNHVTAIFRKSQVQRVGGYPRIEGFLEDWWIGLRLMKHGYRIDNLPKYHVHVRGDEQFVRRRGGWGYLKHEWHNLFKMCEERLITRGELLQNICLRSTVRLMPNRIRGSIYRLIRTV